MIYNNYNNIKLISFKECIDNDLYEMYQDIPKEEIGPSDYIIKLEKDRDKKVMEILFSN